MMKESTRTNTSSMHDTKSESYKEDAELHQSLLITVIEARTEDDFVATVKAMSFMSGSLLAALSQIILYLLKWDDSIVDKSTSAVILFSLQWTFCTLITVFIGISIEICCLSADVPDEVIFQMEAYNIAGALSAVAVTWLLNDMITIPSQFVHDHSSIIIGATLILYGSFCASILMQSRPIAQLRRLRGDIHSMDGSGSTLSKTYQMIAGLAGLFTGATSQFLLAMFLWKLYDDCQNGLSVFLFSLLWCISTVAVTAMGFGCIQQILMYDTSMNVLQRTKLQLQMDSHYVRSTLIGICVAWLLLDIFMDTTERILPSIGMLILSLLVFRAFKRVYPEDNLDDAPEHESVELTSCDTAVSLI